MVRICLWFDGRALEAARYYTRVLRDGRLGDEAHFDDATAEVSGQSEGDVMTVPFEVEGQLFLGLNGGPMFQFSEATSLIIQRDTQAELDQAWDALCDGGEPGNCGWLKDRFGVSWQVVPSNLMDYLGGDDAAGRQRATEAMLKMHKLEIDTLRRAYEGEPATA